MTDNSEKLSEKPKDIYKDTSIRYLGYANEVGEAFRSLIGSKWVMVSYGIATVYVIADAAHKTKITYDKHKKRHDCFKKTAFTATDTLTWQMLASVIFPGFTINRICAMSTFLLKKNTKIPKSTGKLLVTGIGLVAIPFIIKPIDQFVDKLLDESLRKLEP